MKARRFFFNEELVKESSLISKKKGDIIEFSAIESKVKSLPSQNLLFTVKEKEDGLQKWKTDKELSNANSLEMKSGWGRTKKGNSNF